MYVTHNLPIELGTKPLVERVMNTAWYVRNRGYLEFNDHAKFLNDWDGTDMDFLYGMASMDPHKELLPKNDSDVVKLKLMRGFYHFWKRVEQQDQIKLVKLIDWKVYEPFINLVFLARPRVIVLKDLSGNKH